MSQCFFNSIFKFFLLFTIIFYKISWWCTNILRQETLQHFFDSLWSLVTFATVVCRIHLHRCGWMGGSVAESDWRGKNKSSVLRRTNVIRAKKCATFLPSCTALVPDLWSLCFSYLVWLLSSLTTPTEPPTYTLTLTPVLYCNIKSI
jgi:hypothetical protein